jgi:hypothetical protein
LQDFVSVGGMARKLPVPYPGAIYLMLNRRDRRAPTFFDAKNRRLFLDIRSGASEKAGGEIHACCLLSSRKGVDVKML